MSKENAIRKHTRRARRGGAFVSTLLGIALLVGIIYVAKPVLVPLALAVLFTFILTPLVTLTQRRGIPRVPATLLVVGVTLVGAAAIGWGVEVQFSRLADTLPARQTQIQAKINRLRGDGTGSFGKLLAMFQQISAGEPKPATRPAVTQPVPESVAAGSKLPATRAAELTEDRRPVVVSTDSESPMQRLADWAGVVLEPVANSFLVLILVIFMLIRREDLRSRMIGLLGHGRLTGTTRVTVEAATRLSKYLLAQLSVNVSFGIVFGLGLRAIGVQYALLWGFLTALLRFIPFVGTWLAASAPVILSFAMSDGWGQPLLVLGFFVVLDLSTANVLEPILFGHSTGVSPVALLIAAAFWTWIWGPVGLVLSTPLTVCLVVMGQHVPRLRVLSMLLGDRPVLPPYVNFYQRLLAGDRREASDLVLEYRRDKEPETVYDEVLLPALRRMRRDREFAGLTAADEDVILTATDSLIPRSGPQPADTPLPGVLAIPSHHRAEELTLEMLANLLDPAVCRTSRVSTKTLPIEIENRIERDKPKVLFIAVMPPGGLVQARYLCRRLGKRFADLSIVVGYWGKSRNFDRLLVRFRQSRASYVTTSLIQTRAQITALLGNPRPAPAAVETNA